MLIVYSNFKTIVSLEGKFLHRSWNGIVEGEIMKFLTAFLVMSAFAVNASAMKMVCDFTEPFITLKVDTESKIVEINDANVGQKTLARIGSINETRRHIALTYGADKILVIAKKAKGNNGMSDKIYNFSGSLRTVGQGGMTLVGGCDLK